MNAIASHLDSFNPNNLNGELDIFVQEIEPSKDKTFGLESLGIKNIGRVYRNLSVAELNEWGIDLCKSLKSQPVNCW